MTQVKICGITSFEDALATAEAGADLLGFNFFRRSPRYVTPEAAQPLCDRLRQELGKDCPLLVGVFVNEVVGRISITMEQVGLNCAQLSGDESAEMLAELRGIGFKSIRPRNRMEALDDAAYFAKNAPTNERLPSLLLDAYQPGTYGGTGTEVGLEVALAVKEQVPRMMLAGGLTPENVAERIQAVQPWGVDVASGVEVADQPGKKDLERVKAFIEEVKSATV